MIDIKSFEHIQQELKDYENKRESTIQTSRETITLSKQIIYAVHRDDLKAASLLLKKIKEKISLLEKTRHYDIGIANVAFQEYVEAITYYEFVTTGKILGLKELNVKVEDYLLGLSDLTGELVRKAVGAAIKKDFTHVLKIKEAVEALYGEFLKLELRDWDMRKKADALKWNLNKLEDIVFTLKTGGRIAE